jgi:membrane fusion protein, peptide pheromone/bacteriocin exporter
MVMILFFLGTSFIVKTEITVLARGIVRSMSNPVHVTVPISGEVDFSALQENRLVSQGDTLLILKVEKLTGKLNYLNSVILEYKGYVEDLVSLTDGKTDQVKTSLIAAAGHTFRQKIEDLDLNIDYNLASYKRIDHLFLLRVVPKTDFEEAGYRLKKAREDRNSFIEMNHHEWQKMIAFYHEEIRKLESSVYELKKDLSNMYITAPVSGHIQQSNQLERASFVHGGQLIAIISPDDQLIVESLVSPSDMGFLSQGMKALYQIDTFNHFQWGLASGQILDLPGEIYMIRDEPFFKVRSSLDKTFLALKNGYQGELKKGYTTTVRFRVAERSLAQLVFDKAENWLNPYHK